MSEDVYAQLREFMDTLPGGYPATKSGVEIRILQKLFLPEEAELVMKLKSEPEEVSETADRIGIPHVDLAPKLEEMAQKGLIFRTRRGDKTFYRAFQFVVGLYEFQLNRLDEEFCRLFEKYLPHIGRSYIALKTKQMRIIPVESSLDTRTAVQPYNRVRDLVKSQSVFAVADCICRKEQGLLGKECSRPREVCLMFSDFADYFIENKLGRPITREECLKVLDRAEEAGLVLCPTTSQDLQAICCCCTCCCATLKYAKLMTRPIDMVLSYYRAKVDADLCTACGLCADRCQMAAITLDEDRASISADRCIGCGLCVSSCPVEALSMEEKPDTPAPPREWLTDTLSVLGEERRMLKGDALADIPQK